MSSVLRSLYTLEINCEKPWVESVMMPCGKETTGRAKKIMSKAVLAAMWVSI
jgi:hypothetical protein